MDKVLEVNNLINRDSLARDITNMWVSFSSQMSGWLEEKRELRNYVFATDTTKTTNSKLGWKNKTTIPKLCQIRDNLHANYMAALFPNDDWMKWIGYTEESATAKKRIAIQAYLSSKLKESDFYTTVSDLVYDYIDYGNVIAHVEYVNETKEDPATGEIIPGYQGPKLFRVSPLDIRYNITAVDFDHTPKITRVLKTFGELIDDAQNMPDRQHYEDILAKMINLRRGIAAFDPSDILKADGYMVDGFGTLQEYLGSEYVEVLEFEGSLYNKATNTFAKDRRITIVDRSYVIRDVANPSWLGKSSKVHCGWRKRTDSLCAMGPLDNLVGMQYRIDHLENLKADAMDLAVHPPLVISGEVDEFEYGPGEEIFLDEGGNVTELGKNLSGVIAANNDIDRLEAKMEEMAGAPKQALGFRTPGEKTAYEVQQLENAANRIFLLKATQFEIQIIEKALNRMLENARRNLKLSEIVRVMDDDIGVVDFLTITKEDITGSGKLTPMGARHFTATAQLIQNLTGGLQIGAQLPTIMTHVSGKKMARLLFEEAPGLARFSLVRDNVAVMEQIETQQIINQGQDKVMAESITPIERPDNA